MSLASKVNQKFRELFNESPVIVRSPGRVNLIGEHTDYNMGFVLPAAIDKAIYFAIAPGKNEYCNFYSIDFNEEIRISVNEIHSHEKNWANYLLGVIDQFQKSGKRIGGFNCVFGGDIPIGAGLSSSAAIEAGLAFSLNQIFDLKTDKMELVKLSQRAENEFVGVKCGIMDQYINIFGSSKKVLKIDCRSLEYEYHPFDKEDLKIVLCNTLVSHSLASSEYNKRREECEEGAKILQKHYSEIKSLRDADISMVENHKSEFTPEVFARCKYVVEENERVLKTCEDLDKNDFVSFGKRMYGSHEGLRDLYKVSCPELDFLVESASGLKGVFGSRMMGGGFGGCTINIVEHEMVEGFVEEISGLYKKKYDKVPEIYVCTIENGTDFFHQY